MTYFPFLQIKPRTPTERPYDRTETLESQTEQIVLEESNQAHKMFDLRNR